MAWTPSRPSPQPPTGAAAADGGRVESVNAGVFGYGTDNEAAWPRAYGWPLQPKIVLVGFFVGNPARVKTTCSAWTRPPWTPRAAWSRRHASRAGHGPDGRHGGDGAPACGWRRQRLAGENSHAYLFLRNLDYRLPAPRPKSRSRPSSTPPPSSSSNSRRRSARAGHDARRPRRHARRRAGPRRHAGRRRHPRPRAGAGHLLGRDAAPVRPLGRRAPARPAAATACRLGRAHGRPADRPLARLRAAGKTKLLYFRTDRHWNAEGTPSPPRSSARA